MKKSAVPPSAPGANVPLWIEPFAGSLAVGLRALGVPSHLVAFQGGKAKYAGVILKTLGVSRADKVWCADISPWAPCWAALARSGVAHAAAYICEEWWSDVRTTADARAVWDEAERVVGGAPKDGWGPVEVASWLVYVLGSVRGRPGAGASWKRTAERACYRRSDGHGGLVVGSSPMVGLHAGHNLAKRLRPFPLTDIPLRAWHGAASIPPCGGAIVYMDPPYKGTTGYQKNDIDRDGVLALVEAWRSAGSVVAVSEAEPLPGGRAVDIGALVEKQGRRGTLTREFLTIFDPL